MHLQGLQFITIPNPPQNISSSALTKANSHLPWVSFTVLEVCSIWPLPSLEHLDDYFKFLLDKVLLTGVCLALTACPFWNDFLLHLVGASVPPLSHLKVLYADGSELYDIPEMERGSWGHSSVAHICLAWQRHGLDPSTAIN